MVNVSVSLWHPNLYFREDEILFCDCNGGPFYVLKILYSDTGVSTLLLQWKMASSFRQLTRYVHISFFFQWACSWMRSFAISLSFFFFFLYILSSNPCGRFVLANCTSTIPSSFAILYVNPDFTRITPQLFPQNSQFCDLLLKYSLISSGQFSFVV